MLASNAGSPLEVIRNLLESVPSALNSGK